MCVQCLRRTEEGVGFLGTRVRDNFEPPCWCCEVNSGPLAGQKGLFTREQSLQRYVSLVNRNDASLYLIYMYLLTISLEPGL